MQNKRYGFFTIFLFVLTVAVYAQDEVVLTPYNGDPSSYVNAQVVADTTATNGLLPNRVYVLQRGGIYLQNATLTMQVGQTLRFKAADGDGDKPIIYLWESGTGDNPTRPPGNFVVLSGGNLEMENIAVAGFYEPEPERVDGVQGGLINTNAVGSSIILDGVVFSNINGQHVRTGNNTVRVEVKNSIFANMGALHTSNLGAGKGFDLRDAACDTFICENNTFVNFQDRAIRHYNFGNPTAGTGLINYGRINHNTFINGMGFHGLLSLGSVGERIIITNNLFVDAFSLGEDSTDATRAAEWANTGEVYANGNNRITWIFTSPNDVTDWTVSNNYFVVSPEGQAFLDGDHFGNGPFGVGSPLSYHINSRLGADSVNAFTELDELTLVNRPDLMVNMMNWYEDPAGGARSKNTPGDVFDPETDDFDRRPIQYYMSEFDASYPTSSPAYTGGTAGQPVGALTWFGIPVDVKDNSNVISSFALNQNYPNPFNPSTKISFTLSETSNTVLTVYNVLGQKIATLLSGEMAAGYHEVNFDASNLSSGLYLYKLESGNSVSSKKMMLMK